MITKNGVMAACMMRRRKADQCVHRINFVKDAAVPSPQKKKGVIKTRDYYSDFASSKELGALDDYLDD